MGRLWALLLLAPACGYATNAGAPCTVDGECPVHQSCADGNCATGCVRDDQCAWAQRCDDHGRCVAADGPAVDLGVPIDAAAPDAAGPPAWCGDVSGATGVAVDPASGHCYVAWSGPAGFAQAERQCQAHGGQLATIGSAAEDAIVRGLAGATARWIGLASAAGKDQFSTWRSSEPVGYTGWQNNQPTPAQQRDCVQLDGTGWINRDCGWPGTGSLPPGQMSTAGFVCENACGNGVVDPGEGCDPPGQGCTASCQPIAACSESGAISSTVNGHCYFALPTQTVLAQATCPTGTHLATLDGLAEEEAATQAVTAESWIALRTDQGDAFYWLDGSDFNPRRYHGFISSEPNHTSDPACVRFVPQMGWADHDCGSMYARLCERD
jgi:hypothetical protein